MSELNHECGVAAIYHLPGETLSPLCTELGATRAAWLLPRMLQDIQNRGQLAAGFTTYDPERPQLIDTHKNIGTVNEVFKLSHPRKHRKLMNEYTGRAAIGHVRYATCGKEDKSYAQPFERHHLQKRKWFSFAFNGQLANYKELRQQLLSDGQHHLARETDTEILMHEISRQFSGDQQPRLIDMMRSLSHILDGAYTLAFLNALGEMLIARDPLGIKPMCYALEDNLFAAASESVALLNLGFNPTSIKSLEPGMALTIAPNGTLEKERFSAVPRKAHCFFEWIYFANVASTLDDRSVYLTRTELGVELARLEKEDGSVPIDEDTIVVPVPDTSKAAADSMAFQLGIPSREGLIRNRYSGRTFIESGQGRYKKAQLKYTPLREVLEGKRVFLVEDSIVRSTTMKALLERLREYGGAKEIHVRVACPPIIAPCFYGIDMSTVGELFAPKYLRDSELTPEIQQQMAHDLKADSLRYLPVSSIAKAIRMPAADLCQACITGDYPTKHGQRLYQVAIDRFQHNGDAARTYDTPVDVEVATSTG